MLFCLLKFCLISNYSNSVLFLSIFVLLHKQGKLIIIRKETKKETFDRLQKWIKKFNTQSSINKNQVVSEGTLTLFYFSFFSVAFFLIF